MEQISGHWGDPDIKLYAASGIPEDNPTVVVSELYALIDSPAIRSLIDHWADLREKYGDCIKERIDPLAFVKALPDTYIEEWDEKISQSRLILEGEGIKGLWGGSAKGKSVDEQIGGDINILWKIGDQLNFIEGRATYATYDLGFREREFYTVGDVTLPLKNKDGQAYTIGCIWRL